MSVTELPASPNFTVEQALASAQQRASELTEVLIIATDSDGDLLVRSSRMNRGDALWLLEKAKAYTLSE